MLKYVNILQVRPTIGSAESIKSTDQKLEKPKDLNGSFVFMRLLT